MSQTTRRVIIWGGIILGLAAMLYGLARIGASSPSISNGPANLSLKVPVNNEDNSKGADNAPVTLVEYSDFQCPACKVYYPIIRKLSEEMPDKVKIVYRNYPLRQAHPNAQAAAEASEAAALQGKYWEMHNALFDTQETWSKDKTPKLFFEDLASSLGLDAKRFNADMKSDAVRDKINRDYSSGSGIEGTPSFFLNGKLIDSPRSYDDFKKIIEESAQAGSSA